MILASYITHYFFIAFDIIWFYIFDWYLLIYDCSPIYFLKVSYYLFRNIIAYSTLTPRPPRRSAIDFFRFACGTLAFRRFICTFLLPEIEQYLYRRLIGRILPPLANAHSHPACLGIFCVLAAIRHTGRRMIILSSGTRFHAHASLAQNTGHRYRTNILANASASMMDSQIPYYFHFYRAYWFSLRLKQKSRNLALISPMISWLKLFEVYARLWHAMMTFWLCRFTHHKPLHQPELPLSPFTSSPLQNYQRSRRISDTHTENKSKIKEMQAISAKSISIFILSLLAWDDDIESIYYW